MAFIPTTFFTLRHQWIILLTVLFLVPFEAHCRGLGTPDSPLEIRYMGPGGMAASGFDEVIRAFELNSQKAHQIDPKNPVYKIIVSQ